MEMENLISQEYNDICLDPAGSEIVIIIIQNRIYRSTTNTFANNDRKRSVQEWFDD